MTFDSPRITIDTGARRAIEREAEAHFVAVAESLPALMWMSGPDQRVTWFNRRWLEFTGRSLAQELGHGWTDGIHPDDRERCLEICAEHTARRETFSIEFRLRHQSGRYRWIIDKGAPRFDADGTFLGYTGGCVDIQDRIEATELLRRHAEDLERYAYAAAHDLQEPLRGISLHLDLVQRGIQADDHLQRARDAVDAMRDRIHAMMELTAIDREPVPQGSISADEALDQALALLEERIRQSDAVIVRGKLPKVGGLSNQLSLVFENLVGNALMHGGDRPRVTITAESRADRVVFSINDSGPGIPPERRERVFKLFVRSRDQEHPLSTGLGLALVRKVVERHDGLAWIEDGVDCGACFRFSWPHATRG